MPLSTESAAKAAAKAPLGVKPPSPAGFEIEQEIGRGGMGIVYSARDLALDRDVAVKVLQSNLDPNGSTAHRFVDEARITGQLQHPGIPAIHQTGVLPDGRPFLAMKLIKGRTLHDLLEHRSDPSVERGRYYAVFEATCQAVGYAHARRIIHRDLKPQNVMVGSFGETQVMDWGLAKVLGRETVPVPAGHEAETVFYNDQRSPRTADSATMAGSMLGTPAFMPPEQAGGEIDRIDARADVFGLGGILCVILTGKPPYVAKDADGLRLAAIRGNLNDAFARLDGCGAEREWIDLAKRCLAFEPAHRPADAGELARTVAELRAEAEARAQEAELERARAEVQAREQRKRRKVQQILAAAVFAILALLAVGFWHLDRQAAERRAESERDLQAVELALDQADAALRKENPLTGEIDAALTQAKHRLDAGEAPGLADRFEKLAHSRRLLEQLDEIDNRRWLAGQSRERLDTDYTLTAYPARLQEYGLDFSQDSPPDLAEKVRASPIALPLTAALNAWLANGGSGRLREVLDLLDPDPERRKLRAAYEAKDKAKIAAATAKLNGRSLPPEFAQFVGAHPLTPQEHAMRILIGAQAAHTNHFGLANQTARRLRDNQNNERAAYYRVALALRPTNAVCWNNLAAALQGKGDLDGALAAFQESIRLDGKNPRPHAGLGSVYYDKKDLERAKSEFEEAARLGPTFGMPHRYLGYIHRDQKDFAGALAAYREASRVEPGFVGPLIDIGNLLAGQDDLDGAVAAYREAAKGDASSWIAQYNMGRILLRKKDTAGAVAAFQEAIKRGPTIPTVYNELAMALCGQDKPLQGLQVLRDAVRANGSWLTNTTTWLRYNLVCSAALGAKGPQANVESSRELRGQALDWLNDDLSYWRGAWQSEPSKNRALVHQRLGHWLNDPDLASVRQIEKLPPDERPLWQKLWDDVRKLHGQTGQP
ncbi:MAG TPA: protein kinase [Gemmataceae bacterium]|nr:protein kinase [Gemmataceae bacterium]